MTWFLVTETPLYFYLNLILCFILKGEFNSNDTTVMEGSVQEADTPLKSRHRKRTRCVTVTSSTVSTGRPNLKLQKHC
jgi:hypothetical protein